ncbi:hypothetical protein O181_005477 [Austropuccinia psidii MF-1]|uniref:Uncharacterized protein n=1 Tax=Austropuccinia psidii MF-1 TaxID=1389203 RepID=A0A9Q3GGQ1_9BASI|nr:hypothetical protein [Austropuccinia psidii MF-1]
MLHAHFAEHQSKSHINRRQFTSCRTAWVMSCLHQDNVNCHMCHIRMSLKAQTHFHTTCNVWVITPHCATQQFSMLILVHEKTSAHCLHSYAPTPPPDETLILAPHLRPHHSLRFRTPPHLLLGLQSLCCCGALKLCLQRHPQPPFRLLAPAQHASDAAYHSYACSALPKCLRRSLPSLCLWSAFLTCLQCRLHTLVWCPPKMPQMLLTILKLGVPSDMPPMPLAVPSQHASKAPPHLPDPNAPAAPSR